MNSKEIPIDYEETYKLFQEGRTVAVFQYESAGIQKWKKLLKPTTKEYYFKVNAQGLKRVP